MVAVVTVVTVVAVVTVVPETCYIRMLRSFFKVKKWLSPLCTFLFILSNTEAREEKNITYCFPLYSFAFTAFNFIMRS